MRHAFNKWSHTSYSQTHRRHKTTPHSKPTAKPYPPTIPTLPILNHWLSKVFQYHRSVRSPPQTTGQAGPYFLLHPTHRPNTPQVRQVRGSLPSREGRSGGARGGPALSLFRDTASVRRPADAHATSHPADRTRPHGCALRPHRPIRVSRSPLPSYTHTGPLPCSSSGTRQPWAFSLPRPSVRRPADAHATSHPADRTRPHSLDLRPHRPIRVSRSPLLLARLHAGGRAHPQARPDVRPHRFTRVIAYRAGEILARCRNSYCRPSGPVKYRS